MLISELRKQLDARKIGAVELTRHYLDKINKYDKVINSFITVCDEKALKSAEYAQKIIDRKASKPLTGIPLCIKDNICTKNIVTTCASYTLKNFVPEYNAHVVEKLTAHGIVMLGKTNMDEFSMGGSSQTSYFRGVNNPYDKSRVPGGSSGGSAAAIASGFCAASVASDTGGSIRQPASFCGVTGLKPTYGRVSRHGLIAFAPSLDQIGVIAKSAVDSGLILNTIAGKDEKDPTSCKLPDTDFTSLCGKSLKGLKIGMPKEFFTSSVDGDVKKAVLKASEFYLDAGCELIECTLPSLEYAVMAYYTISSAEAASNLERFDGIKYGHRSKSGASYSEIIENSRNQGFGKEVKRRIMLGNYVLSSGFYDEYYKKALSVRQQIKKEYDNIFQKCNVILTPTTPTTAFKTDITKSNPVKMYMADICTVTANISGLPCISTTCGYDNAGMPIGMSLTGRAFDEKTLICTADSFEKSFTRQEATL